MKKRSSFSNGSIGLSRFVSGLAAGLLLYFSPIPAWDNGLARIPYMGWSSWNCFNVLVYEFAMKDITDIMITTGMRELGYEYVMADGGWESGPFYPRDVSNGLMADPAKFPNGVKSVADYVHSRGMKLGMYMNFRAGLGNIQRDADSLAAWGADHLKVDFFGGSNDQTEYTLWRDALIKTGRPFVYEICRWRFPGAWAVDVGNSWRTSSDLMGTWASMISNLEINAQYAQYAGPGHWNDPDMLQVGNDDLTLEEYRTHFSMWCLAAAPLRAGNDLRNTTPEILAILTAPEIIAINQDSLGIQGTKVKDYGEQEVWMKPLRAGMKAAVLLNRGPSGTDITVNWTDIGLGAGNAEVRDLWARKDLGKFSDKYTANVPSHGTKVIRVIQGGSGYAAAPYAPDMLRCENQINPAGALTLSPWLRWQFRDPDIGDLQSAYQILVANSQADIDNDRGNVWNSQKTSSLNSFMQCTGANLSGGNNYYWKVRVWDQSDSASNYSSYATFVPAPLANHAPFAPSNLKCEGQANPMNIIGYPPDFSWTFNDPDAGAYQSAFRLLVSRTLEELNSDTGTMWDTDLIISFGSVRGGKQVRKVYSTDTSVTYGGAGLEKGKTYYWKIMTWDENGAAGPYSAAGTFSMADAPGANVLLDPGYESDGYMWNCAKGSNRSIDTVEVHSGSKSEKMVGDNSYPREVYQDAAIIGNHTYRAGTWIKTSSLSTSDPNLQLIWLDTLLNGYWDIPARNILRWDTVCSITGTNNWKNFSSQYAAPSKAISVRFYLFANKGSGTIWFDDNELTDLSATGSPRSGNKGKGNKPAKVFIFPNPCNVKTTIFFPFSSDPIITRIFDIHGQMVASFNTIHKKKLTWKADGLASGMYIVDVKIADKHYQNRILLQRGGK